MAGDVLAAMQARGDGRYSLIEHSMGGKVAMAAALIEPSAVESLVVVDIAPVTYPMMPYAAYVQAMQALDLGTITRRRGADAKLTGAIGDATRRAFLLQNLVLGDGPPHWRINLPAIEASLPTLAGFPSLPAGRTLRRPGAVHRRRRPSGSLAAEHEPAVTARFRNAAIVRLAEADHWVHTDAPEEFLALVEPFLATQDIRQCRLISDGVSRAT